MALPRAVNSHISWQTTHTHIYQSIEEHPPPYTEAGQPPTSVHPKPEEPLPEYSTQPKPVIPSSLPIQSKTSGLGFLRRFWLYIILIILAIAGIIAGISISELRKRSLSSGGHDAPNPAITALTAAGCDAGSFVFYQDNLGDIYLQGNLKNGTWNQTNSGLIPKTKIQIPVQYVDGGYTPPSEYVSDGTNLTAVCWSDDIGIVGSRLTSISIHED